jgi:hypothetical protein
VSRAKPETQAADVYAEHGVAAGRDIRDTSIKIGLDEEGVRQLLREELGRIAGEKGIAPAALEGVLAKLHGLGIADDNVIVRLNAAADQLIDLRAELNRLSHYRPELASFRREALALVDAG